MIRKNRRWNAALVVQAVAVLSFGPLAAKAHGDVAGGEVMIAAGIKNERSFAAAFHQRGVLALDDVEPADSGTDVYADLLSVFSG